MKEYGGTFTQERYIEEELVRYEYRIEYSSNGTDWAPYEETQNTVFPHKLIPRRARARYIRIVFASAPYGQNFSISGLRVFGLDNNKSPRLFPAKMPREQAPPKQGSHGTVKTMLWDIASVSELLPTNFITAFFCMVKMTIR